MKRLSLFFAIPLFALAGCSKPPVGEGKSVYSVTITMPTPTPAEAARSKANVQAFLVKINNMPEETRKQFLRGSMREIRSLALDAHKAGDPALLKQFRDAVAR